MHDERRTRERGLLPIEARRILWDRLWGRLLAPPEEAGGDATGSASESTNQTSGAVPTGEEGR